MAMGKQIQRAEQLGVPTACFGERVFRREGGGVE
jgi:hypothetical protein